MTAVHPRPASTVILVRPGTAEPEILLLKRNAAAKFMPNAFVFAGGAVDPQDGSEEMRLRCSHPDDIAASAMLDIADGGQQYFVAAVREAFEECGLLLAYDVSGELADLSGVDPARLRQMRDDLCSGAVSLDSVCASLGWCLALDRLFYFAHWVTPATLPRRFDTRFFLAVAPPRQAASLASQEMSELVWRTAAQALREQAEGRMLLYLATRTILEEIADFHDMAALLAHASGPRNIRAVMPSSAAG